MLNGTKVEITINGDAVPSKAKCPECDRVFDLDNEDEAGEWFYGHGQSWMIEE